MTEHDLYKIEITTEDDLGHVWRFYWDKCRIVREGDTSKDPGYNCISPLKIRSILKEQGYISE